MRRLPVVTFLLGLGMAMAVSLRAQTNLNALSVAAAGDLRGTLEEAKAAFEATHPAVKIELTFGASGSLTAQIQQGAPYDLFLSADVGFPEQLRQAGLITADGPFPYAKGYLTLWLRREIGVDPAVAGLRVLLDPRIKRIAVANPKLAPYGRAAEGALANVGLLESLRPKFVFGENIAQAAQFLQTGASEAGLISQSQARHPALESSGLAWKVPEEIAPPLRQHGVVLARSRVQNLAKAFRDFLIGSEGQVILARHGFGKP